MIENTKMMPSEMMETTIENWKEVCDPMPFKMMNAAYRISHHTQAGSETPSSVDVMLSA